eukprot:CFRG3300T1
MQRSRDVSCSYPDLQRASIAEENEDGDEDYKHIVTIGRRGSLALSDTTYNEYQHVKRLSPQQQMSCFRWRERRAQRVVSYESCGHLLHPNNWENSHDAHNCMTVDGLMSDLENNESSGEGARMRHGEKHILGGARTSSRQTAVPPPSTNRAQPPKALSESATKVSVQEAPGGGVVTIPGSYRASTLGYLVENYVAPSLEVLYEVNYYWFKRALKALIPSRVKVRLLKQSMDNATSYGDWYAKAMELDRLEGRQAWKMEFACDLYDNHLLEKRLEALRRARARPGHDAREMMYLIRSGLFRNLGNMLNPALFMHCNVGTKRLIEKYNDEVVFQLTQLANVDIPGTSLEDRMEFVRETRQAFGRSALCLSGGGTLGGYHVGVVKALIQHDLLPRIITGSSAGAIVAAVVGCTLDEDLIVKLNDGIPFDAFAEEGCKYPLLRKIERLFKEGVLAEKDVLIKVIRESTGDMTFQESYNHTRRIVNISVNSSNPHEPPRLLNYLTAPNVVIWSGVAASCALPLLFRSVELMAKDKTGALVPADFSGDTWTDGSVQSDLPMNRLAEMFNVNHFIVSQTNPHIVPFIHKYGPVQVAKKWFPRMYEIASGELNYRVSQLAQLGVPLSDFCLSLLNQKYTGHITVVPNVELLDFFKIVDNPTKDWLAKCSSIGEQSTWPMLAAIRVSCEIEMCLDRVFLALQERSFENSLGKGRPLAIGNDSQRSARIRSMK